MGQVSARAREIRQADAGHGDDRIDQRTPLADVGRRGMKGDKCGRAVCLNREERIGRIVLVDKGIRYRSFEDDGLQVASSGIEFLD